ncbi:hypothetical protein [Halodesulfovibrio aestuarii]|uniref:Uncharacterized protein n=1 Tax=Halodesulfovibrio aestuarii TaxID=126333 RepID=A0ABV4JRZ2_9BACT
MPLIDSLLSKPVEMTQLQKTVQTTMQKKSASGSVVSNLFVNQQTDHSKYIRAALESSRAVQNALDNKMNTMTSLLQAQMSFEESSQAENNASYFGPLDLSYSRRARIGARAAQLLNLDQSKEVQRISDAATETGHTEEHEGGKVSTPEPTRVSTIHVSRGATVSAPAKISIRV